MSDVIDFTNKTREEFEAWACPDGAAVKIKKDRWGDGNVYVIFNSWHEEQVVWFRCEDELGNETSATYKGTWQLYTEPSESEPESISIIGDFMEKCEQYEPEQVDTSTPEGCRKIICAYFSCNEVIEYKAKDEGVWNITEKVHPSNWNLDRCVFRIKPQRVPQVGDVWEGPEDRELVLSVEDGHLKTIDSHYIITQWRDREVGPWKYIGHIDLSLLEGAE